MLSSSLCLPTNIRQTGQYSARPPHSVLFRVRICLFPLFESTPYLRTANISEPPFRGLFAGFSRAFPALETPLNTVKWSMYPPKFWIISQQSKEMREKKKNTPFFKKSPGEKSNTPLLLQFSGRTLSHEMYPFTGHFGNTHAVISKPEWGGGGPGYSVHIWFLVRLIPDFLYSLSDFEDGELIVVSSYQHETDW